MWQNNSGKHQKAGLKKNSIDRQRTELEKVFRRVEGEVTSQVDDVTCYRDNRILTE